MFLLQAVIYDLRCDACVLQPRCQQALENAGSILDREFEACEIVRGEVDQLQSGKVDPKLEKEWLDQTLGFHGRC